MFARGATRARGRPRSGPRWMTSWRSCLGPRDPLAQQAGRTENQHQDQHHEGKDVLIVGTEETAGQLADSFHLLRLRQDRLGLAPLDDFRDGEETVSIVVREPEASRSLLSAVDSVYVPTESADPGHRLEVELSCDEPLTDAHNALLPPDAFHLPVGRPVTHKIYRDTEHPSRLVLPYTVG